MYYYIFNGSTVISVLNLINFEMKTSSASFSRLFLISLKLLRDKQDKSADILEFDIVTFQNNWVALNS